MEILMGYIQIYKRQDSIEIIFHCYGRNHNATSHVGSIKKGYEDNKGKMEDLRHARSWVCQAQEARSRNRATMITMMKSGIFCLPTWRRESVQWRQQKKVEEKKNNGYADVQRASRISRRHVRKEKKMNGLLQKTPKMLSTSHAVLLWR